MTYEDEVYNQTLEALQNARAEIEKLKKENKRLQCCIESIYAKCEESFNDSSD